MKVAGIDIGSTNIKIVIVDADKNMIEKTIKMKTPISYAGEMVDIDRISSQVISMIYEVKTEYDIKLFGISSMAPVLVLVNKSGNAIGGLMYNSLVGSEYIDALDKELLMKETLNPPNIQMIIHKLIWISRNLPNILVKIKRIIDLNGYIFYKLVGQEVQDTHTALEWGLLNYKTKSWSSEILELLKRELGFDVEKILPQLEEPTYTKNGITLGTVDIICGAKGLGLDVNEDKVAISYGTTLCAGTVYKEPKPQPTLYNDLYFDKGYLINGCNSMYGSLLDWFKEKMSLEIKIEDIDERRTNVIFLPYLQGERSPIFDPHAKGVIFGLTSHNSIKDIAKALVHSLAYIAANMVEHLGVKRYAVSYGGLARSPIVDIVSSLLMMKQEIVEVEASALGAALIALENVHTHIDRNLLIKPKKTIIPSEKLREEHDVNYKIFKDLYIRLRDVFQLINSAK